jgi:AcrR family transcriptional regulator
MGRKVKVDGDTERKIVLSAIEVFAKVGFTQATFQAISDRCGLSQAAAFYYFKNKEALVLGALKLIVVDNYAFVSTRLAPEDGAAERLFKHFEGNVRWAMEMPAQAQVLLLLFYQSAFNREFSQRYVALMDAGRQRIADYLHAGKREKVFTLRDPVDLLTQLLHDELSGAMVSALCRRPLGPADRMADAELERLRPRWEILFKRLLGAK